MNRRARDIFYKATRIATPVSHPSIIVRSLYSIYFHIQNFCSQFRTTIQFITMPLALIPYISISAQSGGAKKAIAWYKKVFGAQVKCALSSPQNPDQIGHAELVFGGNHIMLSEAFPGMSKTPEELGGTPTTFFIQYPKNSKSVYDNAIKEGATVIPGREYKEQPWGWDAGSIVDPFGYQWTVGEDTKGWSDEETAKQLGMNDVSGEF